MHTNISAHSKPGVVQQRRFAPVNGKKAIRPWQETRARFTFDSRYRRRFIVNIAVRRRRARMTTKTLARRRDPPPPTNVRKPASSRDLFLCSSNQLRIYCGGRSGPTRGIGVPGTCPERHFSRGDIFKTVLFIIPIYIYY